MKTIKFIKSVLFLILVTNVYSQESYPNGQVKSIGNKQNGEYIEYFEDGTIIEKCSYKNGKKNGLEIEVWDNKRHDIRYKRNYKDGKLNGIQTEYHDLENLHCKLPVFSYHSKA